MQSFRTELENISDSPKALIEKDIVELEKKIRQYQEGSISEEKFRSLRLARGVYGQRQKGVQMVRIKIPFGKLSATQLRTIAAISDQYSNGNLHLTTRQDIQIHHVSLERTPELWAKLEEDGITLREACGNTVRNITASPEAGIDPEELFDVSPYAQALFAYFLRKPFGQELGRKIKIAFSNNDSDSAFTWIHDLGFIPRLNENGERGFKVLIGGGLGAQPFPAQTAFGFLHSASLIPFTEATLRVFDRYGERASRHKARLKYLIARIGLPEFLRLVNEEKKALPFQTYAISPQESFLPPLTTPTEEHTEPQSLAYQKWKATNVFAQKQRGYVGVYVKVPLGNISSRTARELARLAEKFARAEDIRITINQGLLLKFVQPQVLPLLYEALNSLRLADPGFGSAADITACPGTDTCNLAISNSTRISEALEDVISDEYPDLIYRRDIQIKISGCMNSCGQHGLAQIGFHGSSFKVDGKVIPAVQLLLGGGNKGEGEGSAAEKIIKVASKRAPDVLRRIFNDLEKHSEADESFNDYFRRRGKDYFYQLLKPLADNTALTETEYLDWGSEEKFQTQIGVGECAGVVIDLVQTLFFEAEEKLENSKASLDEGVYSDAIYYAYSAFIHAAKALLLDKGHHVNTHHMLVADFDEHFVHSGIFPLHGSFKDLVLQINKNEPLEAFAQHYLQQAIQFISSAKTYREAQNKLLSEQQAQLN